jgi:phage-related baseplate assembly protein
VAALVARLDGLERRPLPAQVEVLDAVRRGLDEELARPVTDG